LPVLFVNKEALPLVQEETIATIDHQALILAPALDFHFLNCRQRQSQKQQKQHGATHPPILARCKGWIGDDRHDLNAPEDCLRPRWQRNSDTTHDDLASLSAGEKSTATR
jgi:hypothetical protein